MNNGIKMTKKMVRMGVKSGMNMDDFCEKYQCTEAEFEHDLFNLYGYNQDMPKKLIKQIRENGKKSKKAIPKKGKRKNPVNPINLIVAPSGVIEEETAKRLGMAIEEQTRSPLPKEVILEKPETPSQPAAPKKPTPKKSLEELKKSEEKYTRKILNEEKKISELSQKKRSRLTKLHDIQEEIDNLAKEAQKKKTEFDGILEEISSIDNKINESNASKRSLTTEREQLRKQIEEREKVVILVYASGEITAEKPDVNLDDTGSEALYPKLLDREEFENLRLKEIKTLSRVLAIKENLGPKAEFVFDSEELEAAFKK